LLLGQCTQVVIDKQDIDWGMVSDWVDPIALFKLIEKFVLKQSDNQYKTEVLIAKQLSILHFCQDDQVGNATWYGCFITRVGVGQDYLVYLLLHHNSNAKMHSQLKKDVPMTTPRVTLK